MVSGKRWVSLGDPFGRCSLMLGLQGNNPQPRNISILPVPHPARQTSPRALPPSPQQNTYPCSQCLRSFTTLQGLQAHKTTFHNQSSSTSSPPQQLRTNPFPCPRCMRSFTTAQALQAHRVASHGFRTSFMCGKCSRQFQSAEGLRAHKESVGH